MKDDNHFSRVTVFVDGPFILIVKKGFGAVVCIVNVGLIFFSTLATHHDGVLYSVFVGRGFVISVDKERGIFFNPCGSRVWIDPQYGAIPHLGHRSGDYFSLVFRLVEGLNEALMGVLRYKLLRKGTFGDATGVSVFGVAGTFGALVGCSVVGRATGQTLFGGFTHASGRCGTLKVTFVTLIAEEVSTA